MIKGQNSSNFLLLSVLLKSGFFFFRPALRLRGRSASSTIYLSPRKNSNLLAAAFLRLSAFSDARLFSVDLLAYQLRTWGPASLAVVDVFFSYLHSTYVVLVRPAPNKFLTSLDNFFYTYWWSEREASELFGLYVGAKRDSRNLLLDYTWTLHPFLKLFPSPGLVEIFFDSLSSRMFHKQLSLQV